jgi:hypothetical protein
MRSIARLIGITALAAVVVFSMAACGDSGGGGSGSGVKFPVIYENGKFLDGVSVKTGEYETVTGRENGLQKGKVTLKDTYIEIDEAYGTNNHPALDGDSCYGRFDLEFVLTKNLDLTGYDGIQIEFESMHKEWGGVWILAGVQDATGKTMAFWGEWADQLYFPCVSGASGGPVIGYFQEAWGKIDGTDDFWSLGLKDFTHKIKGMSFGTGFTEDAVYNFGNPWQIKAVKFIKK